MLHTNTTVGSSSFTHLLFVHILLSCTSQCCDLGNWIQCQLAGASQWTCGMTHLSDSGKKGSTPSPLLKEEQKGVNKRKEQFRRSLKTVS